MYVQMPLSFLIYFYYLFSIRLVASITMIKNILTLIAYNQIHVVKDYEIVGCDTQWCVVGYKQKRI